MKIFPIIQQVISGGSGPPIADTFSLGITIGDTSVAPADATSFAFTFPDTTVAPTDTTTLNIKGLGDTSAAPADLFSNLGVKATDTNIAPTDVDKYLINLLQADTTPAPTDTAQLKFPPPDFTDTSSAPTDVRTSQANFWLHGSVQTIATGKNLLLDRLFAAAGFGGAITACGVGNSATAAVVGDTQLAGSAPAPVLQAFDSLPTRAGLVVTMVTTFATGTANQVWQELGLFNGTVNGTSIMLNHIAPIGPFTKTAAVSIVVTVTITQS